MNVTVLFYFSIFSCRTLLNDSDSLSKVFTLLNSMQQKTTVNNRKNRLKK